MYRADVLFGINADLDGDLAEFIVVGFLGEHLTADQGTDVPPVYDYGSGEVHKTAVAEVY